MVSAAAKPAVLPYAGRADDWRILSALVLYRLILVALLLVLYQSEFAPQFFQQLEARQFQMTCLGYALAALFLMMLTVKRTPRIGLQAHIHFAIDLAAVTLLVYQAGGVSSGLGMLLLTPAVGCSLTLSQRMAILQAAVATLVMLVEETLRQLNDVVVDTSAFTQSGILGLMFFATSVVANTVAQRARKSEALAERVGSEFANLSRLNESIIESMQTGVLVVDAERRIRTANVASRRLLGQRNAAPGRILPKELPQLSLALEEWLAGGNVRNKAFSERPGAPELMARFTRLGWGANAPILVLLDDASLLRQQAQQMKLASLGRLSASIAHEIRNPLAAIAHAGQLLAESSELHGGDQRLLEIIQRHAGRIDKIVRDVLELTRREAAVHATLPLKEWLLRAVAQYQEGYSNAPRPIDLLEIPPAMSVQFDPNHLQQVLFNLWDNCFAHGRHAGPSAPNLIVLVHAAVEEEARSAYLEVSDNGPGIAAELHERIFEPFFSTGTAGTGLGLYLSRELCEYNHAQLVYVPRPQGACFRILFVPQASA